VPTLTERVNSMKLYATLKNQSNQTPSSHPTMPRSIFGSIIIASSLIAGSAIAAEPTNDPANYSGGIILGSMGAGLTFSAKTDWSLSNNDQIQWRLQAADLAGDFDNADDIDIAGTDYNDGDFSLFSLQTGVDWYPYASCWADEIFFSTGLIFVDGDFEATADNRKSYSVGNTAVTPGDINSLKAEIDNRGVTPYISLGWGNKITGEQGFDFHAELGLSIPNNNIDVRVSAVDPASFLSASDLRAEEKDIEDELNGYNAFAMVALSYHF
jgi:hypothetical protein